MNSKFYQFCLFLIFCVSVGLVGCSQSQEIKPPAVLLVDPRGFDKHQLDVVQDYLITDVLPQWSITHFIAVTPPVMEKLMDIRIPQREIILSERGSPFAFIRAKIALHSYLAQEEKVLLFVYSMIPGVEEQQLLKEAMPDLSRVKVIMVNPFDIDTPPPIFFNEE